MSSPLPPTPPPPGDLCRVLCVDDDPVMQQFFVRALALSGYAVEVVCDGREALERFTGDARGFDLLVTDDRMPGLNGRELVAALRAQAFGGPIVVVAAALSVPERDAYRALGVQQFLIKPLVLDVLRAAVGAAARVT